MTSLSNKNQGLLVDTPNAEFVVPSSFKWIKPKYGPIGSRKEFRLPPVSSSYSTNSDKIVRFFFNNDGLIDFRRGYISFVVTINVTGGTYQRLSQGVWSIFNRVRLTSGPELEDIREYNLLHSLLFEMLHDDEVQDTIGPSVYGVSTQADRNAFGTEPKQYAMPLMAGLFLAGIVPLGALDERLQLEMYIDDPLRFVETDGTNPIVTLTNIYFHYEVMAMTDNYASQIKTMAVGSGMCFPFRAFTNYTQPVLSTQQDLVIPHKSSGIDNIIHVMRNSNVLTTTTINDKFINYVNPLVQQFQLRINNEYYPLEPVFVYQYDPQAYVSYLRWANMWRLGGVYVNAPTIDFYTFNTVRFMICNNLETHPNEGLINPLSTVQGSSNLYLRLQLGTGQPAVPTRIDSFVQHYRYIELKSKKLK